MSEKILITGINGFVGEHVAREFKERGMGVIGVGHDESAHDKVAPLVDEYIQCDLLDERQVSERLSFNDVSAIVHLAGLAAVGLSFEQPQRFMTDNGIMTHHILAKAASDSTKGRVVAVSTGALYDPAQALPLNETSKTHANSPYAVGKLMAENVVHYHRSRGVNAVIARPFNHIGPGQGPGFMLPDFYEQLASSHESGAINVGNIDTKRDYTDVRDIARAYADLALTDMLEHDAYNICSGKSLSGREILTQLQAAMGIENIEAVTDPSKVRPNDIEDIVGDCSRISQELGWTPQVPIEQTVKDFVMSRKL